MQVSTRSHDFIVDTISLADQVGIHLRHVFADSSKLKVLHGANQDVHWLRTAFDIKVVNMFDTGQASRVLWPKGHGLKDLLMKYCKVKADKKQ
jgi:exosome complex exonuclease RRP6